ncbi:MAG: hypothetical protein WBW85_15670 [Terriglobales bacterium]
MTNHREEMDLKQMLNITPDRDLQESISAQLRCSVCPGRSVCLEWRRSLSLRLDYEDIVGALECLEDVLDKPGWRFSLGGNDFCACHAGDGTYYLVCREYVVLRLSGDEARILRCELAGARDALDQERNAIRAM